MFAKENNERWIQNCLLSGGVFYFQRKNSQVYSKYDCFSKILQMYFVRIKHNDQMVLKSSNLRCQNVFCLIGNDHIYTIYKIILDNFYALWSMTSIVKDDNIPVHLEIQ